MSQCIHQYFVPKCVFFLTPIQYGKPIIGVSILNLTGWFWQEIAYMSRHICK